MLFTRHAVGDRAGRSGCKCGSKERRGRGDGHGPYSLKVEEGHSMDIQSLIIFLIVGAVAGWLAGMLVRGAGFGLIGDIVVGVIGAFIAGWLLPRIGVNLGSDFIAAVINALIGAVILLLILRLVKRA